MQKEKGHWVKMTLAPGLTLFDGVDQITVFMGSESPNMFHITQQLTTEIDQGEVLVNRFVPANIFLNKQFVVAVEIMAEPPVDGATVAEDWGF